MDSINRQAAIDAFLVRLRPIFITNQDFIESDAMKFVREVLESLPSAQPKLTDNDMKLIKQLRSYHNGSYAKVIDKLLAIASVQSEIVRCKDCKRDGG